MAGRAIGCADRAPLPSQALAAPCGDFHLTQLLAGGTDTGPSLPVTLPVGPGGCGGGGNPPPPPPDGIHWVTRWRHLDHLGSLRLMTDESGWVVSGSQVDYYPFGMPMDAVPPSSWLFTGHEKDAATGLDYMLARIYSASVGSFTSVDPELHAGVLDPKWNAYSYASQNPIGRVDPNGRKDIRTDDEKKLMESSAFAGAAGSAWLKAARTLNEYGFMVDQGPEGSYRRYGPYTNHSRRYVKPEAYIVGMRALVHTHVYWRDDGLESVPNEASSGDLNAAANLRHAGILRGYLYILTPKGLIRVVGPGPGDWEYVVDGAEWTQLLRKWIIAWLKEKSSQSKKATGKGRAGKGKGTSARVGPLLFAALPTRSPTWDDLYADYEWGRRREDAKRFRTERNGRRGQTNMRITVFER